jgi:hypothetical protein
MRRSPLLLLAILAALTACTGMPRMNEQEERDLYMEYAGEPVDSFSMFGRVDGWRPLGRDKLVVWTGLNDAYLLTVQPSCLGLEFAQRIAITSSAGSRVQSGFDDVRFRSNGRSRERCRITEIRPVNYKQMREDLRAERGE